MSRPATLLVREVDFLMIYSHPIASDLPRGSKLPLTGQNDFAYRPGPVLGPRSYVAAGAVVTTDVPPMHVVTGTNQRTHAAAWPGRGSSD